MRLSRRWYALAGVLLVAAAALGLFFLRRHMNEPAQYTEGPADPAGPVECRIVLNNQAARLALALQKLPPGRLESHGLPPLNNPFVMNELLARVEVRNVSGREFAVLSRTATFDRAAPARSFGSVETAVEDEAGNPVRFYDPTTRSLDESGGPDEHPASRRPALTWLPDSALTYPFWALGDLDMTHPILPGTYLVRAVFRYHEAPGGAERQVRSNPIKVRITQHDIEEWKALGDLWVRY